jgi:2-methylisocitrate lyase-like PEP mutase family enzyme
LHGEGDLDAVIKRLVAFAEAGADVLYAPNPNDMDALRAIVKAVAPKPVNLNISPASGVVSVAELQAAGVRRISFGAAPYRHAMTALKVALEAGRTGDLSAIADGISFGAITKLLPSTS